MNFRNELKLLIEKHREHGLIKDDEIIDAMDDAIEYVNNEEE